MILDHSSYFGLEQNYYDGLFMVEEDTGCFDWNLRTVSIMHRSHSYLFQFVCDHGESSEDTVGRAGDGDDPLWTGSLRDVDPSAALWAQRSLRHLKVNFKGTVRIFGKDPSLLSFQDHTLTLPTEKS